MPVMVDNLKRMGADIEGTDDGMIIHGGKPLHGAVIDSHLDHRVAMSFAVAGTICEGEMEIQGAECVNISLIQRTCMRENKRSLNYPNIQSHISAKAKHRVSDTFRGAEGICLFLISIFSRNCI